MTRSERAHPDRCQYSFPRRRCSGRSHGTSAMPPGPRSTPVSATRPSSIRAFTRIISHWIVDSFFRATSKHIVVQQVRCRCCAKVCLDLGFKPPTIAERLGLSPTTLRVDQSLLSADDSRLGPKCDNRLTGNGEERLSSRRAHQSWLQRHLRKSSDALPLSRRKCSPHPILTERCSHSLKRMSWPAERPSWLLTDHC